MDDVQVKLPVGLEPVTDWSSTWRQDVKCSEFSKKSLPSTKIISGYSLGSVFWKFISKNVLMSIGIMSYGQKSLLAVILQILLYS